MVNPAELTILHYPSPALRMRARTVHKIDELIRSVAARMVDLMHDAKGVGLAAPQIGLDWRLFVTDIPDDGGPKVYLNPSLTNFGADRTTAEEGCLSLPGLHLDIQRPASVTLTAKDLDGREVIVSSDGFPARVWQHEFDHLNGVLIIDRVPADQRQAHRQTLRELRTGAALGGRGL
jgi:peptide deformylase